MASSSSEQQDSEQQTTAATEVRKGNEVFSALSGGGGMASVSREDYAKKEFGFDIPVDAVPLPSSGKVYPEGHPLHGAAQVEYRAMTAREEDILMSQGLIKKGTVITELIKSSLIDKSINVSSLLSGDRNALMVGIRISGYGREYQPTFDCPQCEHKNEMNIDLANLAVKPLELEPSVPGQNVFGFDLPVSKLRVEFKFLTGEEEEKIIKELETKRKRGQANTNIVTTRLSSQILSVNGNSSPGHVAKFVNYLRAQDSRALREYIDANEPGVDMEVEFICASCDHSEKIQLPMSSDFFWPKKRA
jgi:hypothetical protein